MGGAPVAHRDEGVRGGGATGAREVGPRGEGATGAREVGFLLVRYYILFSVKERNGADEDERVENKIVTQLRK
jgi:hypothetical protein